MSFTGDTKSLLGGCAPPIIDPASRIDVWFSSVTFVRSKVLSWDWKERLDDGGRGRTGATSVGIRGRTRLALVLSSLELFLLPPPPDSIVRGYTSRQRAKGTHECSPQQLSLQGNLNRGKDSNCTGTSLQTANF